MKSCYIDINVVYTIGKANGYQIVVIDGYDSKNKMPWDSKKMPLHGNALCNHQLL
jgi:hypothetical protein